MTDLKAPFRQPDAGRAQDDVDIRAQAVLALEAGQIGGWSWDIVRNEVRGDQLLAELFEIDFATQPWAATAVFGSIHPDDQPNVQSAVAVALERADFYEAEFRVLNDTNPDAPEQTRWLGARGQVTERADDGTPLKMVGVNWDVTDSKLLEQRLSVLASEMDHRVKNAFAVIRALVNLGMRSSSSKEGFGATLKTQVEAMATAHTVSARMARMSEIPDAPIPLAEVLDIAISPWVKNGIVTGHQVTQQLAPEFVLRPQEVSPASMLIYELATNAAKYGALGERGGHLLVSGDVKADGTRVLTWKEECRVPLSEPIETSSDDVGFGSVLVNHCAKTLGATVDRTVTPAGYQLVLEMRPS